MAPSTARPTTYRVEGGARVLAVGGPGVAAALQECGLRPVAAGADEEPEVAAVMMGFGREVSWQHLAAASYAVAAGALFVATNTDLTYPSARGIAPGNGTLVAAVVHATGREPLVAGKPHEPLLHYSVDRTAAARPLVVGDRLDTDIEAAHGIDAASLLVLTGVTDVPTLLHARPEHRPTYLAADLRGLLARGRTLRTDSAAQVGDDGRLRLAGPTEPADPLRRLRAAAAACWAHADTGGAPALPDDVRAELEADVRLALEH